MVKHKVKHIRKGLSMKTFLKALVEHLETKDHKTQAETKEAEIMLLEWALELKRIN